MNLVQHNRIYNPQAWGDKGNFFAFSPDGQLVAVRQPHDWENENKRNIFVYDLDGNEKWSYCSLDGGSFSEAGIAFFPDKYHVLVPGADENHKGMDGLKKYSIGQTGFTLPFEHTALNGINTAIQAVSDGGESILGRKDGLYCISGRDQISLPNDGFSEAYFSQDANFLVFTGFLNHESWIFLLSDAGNKIKLDGVFVCFLPNQQMLLSTNTTTGTKFSIWSLDTLEKKSELDRNQPVYSILSGACSNDGNLIAMCDVDGVLSLWRNGDFSLLDTVKLSDQQSISRMKFSYDGRYLLTVIMDGKRNRQEVVVWEIQE
jgi:WD40 repeat protein